ncbi:hypothetical protein D3C76_540350 [compost metagenome]
MHHDGAGEIVEGRAEPAFQPALQAEVGVPHHAFEEGIDEGHDQRGGAQLRAEFGALGDAAGNDRRDGRGEGQQEEELHQRVAVLRRQLLRRLEEVHAIGDPVADEEIGQGGDGEVGEDLRQRVDLVLQPHRADFEKGETGVHGQDHDRADEDEKRVGTVDKRFHGTVQVIHESRQPQCRSEKHQNGPSLHASAPH